MKRLLVLGLIAWVFLSGCSVNFNLGSLGSDEAIRFSGYDEFREIEKDLDKDYFAVDKTLEVREKDVDSLDFATVSGDVEIIYEDRKTVMIHYFGFFSEKDKEPQYKITEKGDVKFEVEWRHLKGPHHTEMKVYLPEGLNLPMISSSVSGDLYADELDSESLAMDTVSGDIRIQSIKSEKTTFGSVSGDILIESLEGKNSSVETVSGDVDLSADIKNCNIDTTSGDITLRIDEQAGDLLIDSVSGKVYLYAKKYNAALDLDSVSGDIVSHVGIDSMTKKDHSLTGTINAGKYDLIVETVSGDIELNK